MKSSITAKKSNSSVLWWVTWIVLTIGSFFVASAIWTPFIARHWGTVRETKNAVIWVAFVFGTWMVFLLPLIVWMYRKVDKAYEDARLRREKAGSRFRSVLIEKSKRELPESLSKKLENWPEAIRGGHLVHVILKDGRKIPHVFVTGRSEILGIYDAVEMNFEAKDITDLEPADLKQLPSFFATNWLRLDGVTPI